MNGFKRGVLRGLVVGGVLTIGFAGVAAAHTPHTSGVATCNTDSGTYSVTYSWSAVHVPTGDPADLSLLAVSPVGATVTGLPQTVAGPLPAQANNQGPSAAIVVSNIPGTATSTELTIHALWTGDHYSANVTASVELPGDCTVPATTTTLPPTTTTTVPPTTTTTVPPTTTTTLPEKKVALPAPPPFTPPAPPAPAPVITVPPTGNFAHALVAPPTPAPLAFTGANIGLEAGLGVALIAVGCVVLALARRGRDRTLA